MIANVIETTKLIASLIPVIMSLVKSVESAIPAKGTGAEKLALLKNILLSVDEGYEALWPQIQAIVAAFVSTMNAVGVFTQTKVGASQ